MTQYNPNEDPNKARNAEEVYSTTDMEESKVVSTLAYLGILFFLPLVVTPESNYGKYHANQGLLLFLTTIAGSIAIGIVSFVLNLISIHLRFLVTIVNVVFYLAILALIVIGMSNALSYRAKPLPIIGKLFTIIK